MTIVYNTPLGAYLFLCFLGGGLFEGDLFDGGLKNSLNLSISLYQSLHHSSLFEGGYYQFEVLAWGLFEWGFFEVGEGAIRGFTIVNLNLRSAIKRASI